jgi:hypothetical protein
MIILEVEGQHTREVVGPERRSISTRTVVEEAKARTSTLDLADLLCGPGKLRQVGDKWVARCPLPQHEDRSPSFTVYPETDSFFCFGCLAGGDVIELARHAWGYDKAEVATAAAMLLMEFGHEVPQRPPSWVRRQERQKSMRDTIEDARLEVMMRRLWRWVFEPMLADLEDADERERLGDELWVKVLPLATRLVEDRRGAS